MRRKFFFAWLLFSLCALLAAAFQTALLSRLHIWGVHPFVLPCVAAVTATYCKQRDGISFAAFLGFLCDLAIPSVIPFFYLLTFALTAFLAEQLARRVMVPGFVCSVAVSAMAMVLGGLFTLFFLSFRDGSLSGGFYLLLRETLVTLPAAIPLHLLLSRVSRYLSNV